MKVKDTRIGTVPFERLRVGDVFEYEEEVFLRVYTVELHKQEDGHNYFNAVNLSENFLCAFDNNDFVKRLNAEIVIS